MLFSKVSCAALTNFRTFPIKRICILQNIRAGYASQANPSFIKTKQRAKVLSMENTKVKETVHVYSDKKSSERFYRWLPPFGLIQCIFFSSVGLITLFTKVTDEEIAREESEFIQWLSVRQKKYRSFIICIYFLAAIACVVVCSFYPSRIIKNIWLMKGGNHITVDTFSRFSVNKRLALPLDEVSGKIKRTENTHTIPLKFKDRFAFFLMHTDKGVIHRPDLFDYVIALKRDFPKEK